MKTIYFESGVGISYNTPLGYLELAWIYFIHASNVALADRFSTRVVNV